jgi:hypothetical protein
MGLFDMFRARAPAGTENKQAGVSVSTVDIPFCVADVNSSGNDNKSAFVNSSITYTGDLTSYDYASILKDKQTNIVQLYQLSDYFTDADPIFKGIIKGVYAPFALVTPYNLRGANEAVRERYLDYYTKINLEDRMKSIFLQYFKYANVYLYLMPNGNLVSLPVHLCRIGGMTIGGEPLVEFNVSTIKNEMSTTSDADKMFVKDDDVGVKSLGYPPEIAKALTSQTSKEWVQLDPKNTFVLQDLKEDWQRYAVPMVASALVPFSKKAIIQNYEKSALNIAARGFLHVRVGDPKGLAALPNTTDLRSVDTLFKRAAVYSQNAPIAVTNNWVESDFKTATMDNFFRDDKYGQVNSEILSAGGVNGILVLGKSEDGSTFATAQVSMQVASMRIKYARDNFAELMNKINYRLNGLVLPHAKVENIPTFCFPDIDLAGNKAFQDTCYKLWSVGAMSTQTMLDVHGYDVQKEFERKKSENDTGISEVLNTKAIAAQQQQEQAAIQNTQNQNPNEKNTGGRPAKKDGSVDESKSQTGAQPKPSRPEGSEKQE